MISIILNVLYGFIYLKIYGSCLILSIHTYSYFASYVAGAVTDEGLVRSVEDIGREEDIPAGKCGTRDRMVKAEDPRSRVMWFDSRSTDHAWKHWASFESTLPLATQQ